MTKGSHQFEPLGGLYTFFDLSDVYKMIFKINA